MFDFFDKASIMTVLLLFMACFEIETNFSGEDSSEARVQGKPREGAAATDCEQVGHLRAWTNAGRSAGREAAYLCWCCCYQSAFSLLRYSSLSSFLSIFIHSRLIELCFWRSFSMYMHACVRWYVDKNHGQLMDLINASGLWTYSTSLCDSYSRLLVLSICVNQHSYTWFKWGFVTGGDKQGVLSGGDRAAEPDAAKWAGAGGQAGQWAQFCLSGRGGGDGAWCAAGIGGVFLVFCFFFNFSFVSVCLLLLKFHVRFLPQICLFYRGRH